MNQKTSFMDLSQVYGSTETELKELLHSDGMRLKFRKGFDGANGPVGDILPFTQGRFTSLLDKILTFH